MPSHSVLFRVCKEEIHPPRSIYEVPSHTRFIKLFQTPFPLSQANYKARHDKHQVDHQFQVGDKFWLYINKERLKGEKKEDQTD